MKIAIYFKSNHLPQLSFGDYDAGLIGLSGTDGEVLRLYQTLKSNVDVFFLTNSNVRKTDYKVIHISNSTEAVHFSNINTVDVLIFNNRADDDTREALEAIRKTDIKCIVWDQNGPSNEFGNLFDRIRNIKRIICVSEIHANEHRHRRYFKKVDFIYNTLRENYHGESKANKTSNSICFLGAVSKAKGFHHLVKCWSQVRSEFPDATLKVIGSAQLYNNFAKLGPLQVAEMQYEERYVIPFLGKTREDAANNGVTFIGLANPREIDSIISSCVLGVVNSNTKNSRETFCVSAIEIQNCYVPVIGAYAGGLRETVADNETGFLIKKEKDLGKAIVNALKDPPRLAKMGETAKKFVVDRFDKRVSAQRWLNVIRDVYEEKPYNALRFPFHIADSKLVLKELIRRLN